MACCGPDGLNIDFSKEQYNDIFLNIDDKNHGKKILKFHPELNYGIFSLENNANLNQDSEEVLRLKNEINELENIIKSNNVKAEKLNAKIEEIDNKIEDMNKILNVDISEREYLNYLASKITVPQDGP